ncbi:uncharacterized protein ACB058_005134 [Synchiropus picturatus]
MTSKSFVIAALAVGCLLIHVSAAATVSVPATAPTSELTNSLNLTDQQWTQIFAEAQSGNTTELTILLDAIYFKIDDAFELAEDHLETYLETAATNLTNLVFEKQTLTEQHLLNTNRTTPLTLDEVKQVVSDNIGSVNDKVNSQTR